MYQLPPCSRIKKKKKQHPNGGSGFFDKGNFFESLWRTHSSTMQVPNALKGACVLLLLFTKNWNRFFFWVQKLFGCPFWWRKIFPGRWLFPLRNCLDLMTLKFPPKVQEFPQFLYPHHFFDQKLACLIKSHPPGWKVVVVASHCSCPPFFFVRNCSFLFWSKMSHAECTSCSWPRIGKKKNSTPMGGICSLTRAIFLNFFLVNAMQVSSEWRNIATSPSHQNSFSLKRTWGLLFFFYSNQFYEAVLIFCFQTKRWCVPCLMDFFSIASIRGALFPKSDLGAFIFF